MFKPFRSFCRVYMNDIVVFSKTFEKHFEHLIQIFQFFNNKNIMVFLKKSFLTFSNIILFDQWINNLEMFTTAKKIKAILNLLFPVILKELNYFLRFIEWLYINIKKYAQLANLLQAKKIDLIHNINKIHKITTKPICKTFATRFWLKQPFSNEFKTLQDIQNAFCKDFFLMYFQHIKSLFINVNAFKKNGFAVMIYHFKISSSFFKNSDPKAAPFRIDIEPIMFLFKLLNDPETKYWPTKLEMAALVWIIKKVCHMIKSVMNTIIIYIDHTISIFITRQTTLATSFTNKLNFRLIRVSQYLSKLNISLRHRVTASERKSVGSSSVSHRRMQFSPIVPIRSDNPTDYVHA